MENSLKFGFSFTVTNKLIKGYNDFLNIAKEIFNCFNLPITYISTSLMENHQTRTLLYTEKNLQKFIDLTYDDISSVMFNHNSTKSNWPTNFNLYLDFRQLKSSGFEIFLTYKTEYGILLNPLEAGKTFLSIITKYGEVVRGFGLVMDNEKFVELYIQGTCIGGLTDEENKIPRSIIHNRKTNKLPDIFYVNILSSKLVPAKLYNEVESIVGKEHITNINDNLIFDLPFLFDKYVDKDNVALNNLKHQLRTLLEEFNLLFYKF